MIVRSFLINHNSSVLSDTNYTIRVCLSTKYNFIVMRIAFPSYTDVNQRHFYHKRSIPSCNHKDDIMTYIKYLKKVIFVHGTYEIMLLSMPYFDVMLDVPLCTDPLDKVLPYMYVHLTRKGDIMRNSFDPLKIDSITFRFHMIDNLHNVFMEYLSNGRPPMKFVEKYGQSIEVQGRRVAISYSDSSMDEQYTKLYSFLYH